jgi:hypothetical protein
LSRKPKHPPWYKTFSKSAQQEAIDIFAAKHKAQQMRDDLRTYVGFTYGPNKWQELLRIEADVRRQRQEHEYARREMIAKLTSAALIGLCALTIGGLLWLIIWLILEGQK